MSTYIKAVDSDYPSKKSLMKDARDASRRFTTDAISSMLKTNLNDIGFNQVDKNKSGFQYLQEVLDSSFTEDLPGQMAPYSPIIEALDVASFSNWTTNCDIIRAVKDTIRYFESQYGGSQ